MLRKQLEKCRKTMTFDSNVSSNNESGKTALKDVIVTTVFFIGYYTWKQYDVLSAEKYQEFYEWHRGKSGNKKMIKHKNCDYDNFNDDNNKMRKIVTFLVK